MIYEPKNFENLIGIKGLSDQLLKNHFTLYQGYVINTNKLTEILGQLLKEDKAGSPEYAELKRRLGWEFNGMRLHEYYFGNLIKGGRELDKNSKLFKEISREFLSYESWEKDFKSLGAIRGIGWVILYYDLIGNRLFNVWVNEHDLGHFSGAIPLLIMDVFEHAYLLDFGLKKTDYIETFFKMIDWQAAAERIEPSSRGQSRSVPR